MESNLLTKNVCFAIHISYNFVYANLVYLNQEGYILRDKSLLANNFDNLSPNELFDYWLSYFRALEKKWKWSILQSPKVSGDNLIVNLKKFNAEGEGISGCQISILKSNPNYQKIFESLRKFSLDLRIVAVDKDSDQSLLEKFAFSLNYDDFLLLDLNSRFFKLARVEKEENNSKNNLSKAKLPHYRYSTAKIKWEQTGLLLELLNGLKYKSFLSKYLSSNFVSNIWGNFLLRPVLKSNSVLLEDFVRSYITVQLLSLCADNPKVSRDFAVKPLKNVLWVTGDLVEIPEFKKLLISIIDGLQLRGTFDFVFDKDSLLYTFGKNFSDSEETCLGRKEYLPKFIRVFAPDIDLKPDARKVVFSGALFDTKGRSMEVFGMSSEFTEINIKSPETMYLEGRFIKNAYVEGYRKLFEFYCVSNDIYWEKIILDCRVKPVVYGPDAKANEIKFNLWLSGESYS